jgi:hypothetical protein
MKPKMLLALFSLIALAPANAAFGAAAPKAAAPAPAARAAQLDPGIHDVFQSDKGQTERRVGQIFVPERTADETSYVEHWVLFADYVYPNNSLSLITQIRPSRERYASLEEFLARVPWGPGYRYVRVAAFESDSLPTPR